MRKPDPRVLMLITTCFSTMGVLIEKTWLLAAVFVLSIVIAALMGVKLLVFAKKIKSLIIIVVLIALIQSIFQGGGRELFSIGDINIITTQGLMKGENTVLRIGTVVVSASIFTTTTSRRMIQGLIQLKIPYELAFMSLVALKFIPVFAEEFSDCTTAIQLRGLDIKKTALNKKIKLYVSVLTPVVFGAVLRAQKLAYVMQIRAFRAFPMRTSRFTLKLCITDYIYMFGMLALTVTVLVGYNYFL